MRYQAALHPDKRYSNTFSTLFSTLHPFMHNENDEDNEDNDIYPPGLVAIGGDLEVPALLHAYRNGIFPWFSRGQPILWWSPDPRMVLPIEHFRFHRSLKRVVTKFIAQDACCVRFDTAFADVIRACANTPRAGQGGTWILPSMQKAYIRLHEAGYAHSVETWMDGKLVGGLYCVAIGRAVFGESMFAHVTDASKIALAALVNFCHKNGVVAIDCQQNTRHLASLGAREMPREEFLRLIQDSQHDAPLDWKSHRPNPLCSFT
jgi:leucyl/phenylalanyl-tRNA---protein transferase